MTGTSLDGLDAALVETRGSGLSMRAALLGRVSLPLGELRDPLLNLAAGEAASPSHLLRTARRLGQLHSDAIDALRQRHGHDGKSLDFVAAHGQTICHLPDDGISWQLFDPWPIVRRHGVPVVYDFRQADLIAGGQGAPITPLADWVLYRDQADAVVNLGGICNITAWAGDGELTGKDVTGCNLILDGLVQRLMPGYQYDEDGALAGRGRASRSLIDTVDRFIDEAQGESRTLGREQFDAVFVERLLHAVPGETRSNDVLAAAAASIGRRIAETLAAAGAQRVILAGGGARNRALTAAIDAAGSGCELIPSDSVGVPVEARESAAMAVLGALSQDGEPITRSSVTGAREPGVAGGWAGLSDGGR